MSARLWRRVGRIKHRTINRQKWPFHIHRSVHPDPPINCTPAPNGSIRRHQTDPEHQSSHCIHRKRENTFSFASVEVAFGLLGSRKCKEPVCHTSFRSFRHAPRRRYPRPEPSHSHVLLPSFFIADSSSAAAAAAAPPPSNLIIIQQYNAFVAPSLASSSSCLAFRPSKRLSRQSHLSSSTSSSLPFPFDHCV